MVKKGIKGRNSFKSAVAVAKVRAAKIAFRTVGQILKQEPTFFKVNEYFYVSSWIVFLFQIQ